METNPSLKRCALVSLFVIMIGAWALLVGGMQLYLMTKLDADDKSRTSFLINGVITIIFGVILFFKPFEAAGALLIVTGILAFIIGVWLIVIALKMKSLAKESGVSISTLSRSIKKHKEKWMDSYRRIRRGRRRVLRCVIGSV